MASAPDSMGVFDQSLSAFKASVRYFDSMDCAVYLKKDCSYRSIRVSRKLTLLLDPYEDETVGVKIKGVQHLVRQLLSILDGQISDERRVELQKLLMMALVSEDEAERALAEAEVIRRKQLAERAKRFLCEEKVFFDIPMAMAA